MEQLFPILYLFRTAEKVAISLRNCYAYISFRSRSSSSCNNGKSITAIFPVRIYAPFRRWRLSNYTENFVIPHK